LFLGNYLGPYAPSADMSDADKGSSNKKNRDRIQQLSEIRRGLVHHTDAQYGTADDPMFVMHLTVDGVVSLVCDGYYAPPLIGGGIK